MKRKGLEGVIEEKEAEIERLRKIIEVQSDLLVRAAEVLAKHSFSVVGEVREVIVEMRKAGGRGSGE